MVAVRDGVRSTELAKTFGVSGMTIRNDLDALAELGVLVRVRGGAVAPPGGRRIAVPRRAPLLDAAAQAVVREAAALVEDGDAIALDATDLSFCVAELIAQRHGLTVVAGATDTAASLAVYPSHTVILAGSLLRPDGCSLQRHPSQRPLNGLRVRWALVGCQGWDAAGELYSADPHVAEVQRDMVEAAEGVVLLLTGAEAGPCAGAPFARLAEVSHVLCGGQLPEAVRRRLGSAAIVTRCGARLARRQPPELEASPRRFRIGFANMNDQHPYCLEVRHGLERAAERAGNVELVLADNRESATAAVANAEALIRAGVDLVIEYQIDEAAGNVLMDRLRAADLPVIAIDVPLPGAVFFGVDNYRAGRLAGDALARVVAERWQGRLDAVVVLDAARSGPVPRARLQGALDGLRQALGSLPDPLRVEAGNGEVGAARAVGRLLPALPAGARLGVVGMNDETVLGALETLRVDGRESCTLAVTLGLDRRAQRELRRPGSPLIGGVAFQPESYGQHVLQLAAHLLQGEPVPPAVYLEHELVLADPHRVAGAATEPVERREGLPWSTTVD